ncbi:MAG: hypothetical protein GX585_03450 [Clostridiales bacterium]|nr:hypothetical protein [Clostridiales bacterium]
MECVGIWERGEKVLEMTAAGLRAFGRQDVRLVPARHPAELAGLAMTLLVVSPGATGWAGAGALSCRKVLLPGGAGPLAHAFQAESAVSYGASPKDTLTISSLSEERLCLALQRELVTVDGTVVDRQELVLPFSKGRAALPFLASVGALLLLSVPPEELSAVLPG